MVRTGLVLGFVIAGGAAQAQSGCQMVASAVDEHYRSLGTAEGKAIADGMGALDTGVILQTYVDAARDLAKNLDRGREVTADDVLLVNNLTGMVDCFVGDQDAPVLIDGISTPFSERFSEPVRLGLLDAAAAGDASQPAIACIRSGNC